MKKYTIENYADPNKTKRWDLINYIIKQNNFVNYLEIGVNDALCIRQIQAEHKDGVDPGAEGVVVPEVNYPMTSDGFFELIRVIYFIFIFFDNFLNPNVIDFNCF